MMFLYYFTNYVKHSLFSKMIASSEKFGFVLLSVGYKKILHFLRLDSKELDCIQAVFFKAVFRGILVGELFQNTPYFFKRMGLK
ncbi:hypothetical protein NP0156_10880 [Helicobacter pylori]